MLRFYVEVARTAFQRQLIYRWANVAGLLTNIFFGAILSFVFLALFHARPVAGGYHVRDTLRYIWLMQAMIMVVLPFGWFDLMRTITTGEVASDLGKPCDFYWYWFSREVGRDVYYALWRGAPTYLAGMLLFGIGLLGAQALWLAFAASLVLGAALGIAYRFLYNLVAFWIVEGRAAGNMAQSVAFFFTGSLVPVAFFPSWLHAIAAWLPFYGMMNVPAEVFIGKVNGGALLLDLVRQVLWLVLLTLGARALTVVATRRVILQGG
jgi:ABC-2 type transport system permease protein